MLEHAGTPERAATCGRGRHPPEAPPPGTRRWTARRKARVVDAVAAGWLTLEAACRAYDLSPDELAAWKRALDCYGMEALKVTCRREFRSAPVMTAAQASPVARRVSTRRRG
jgi:transposase-like protein